MGRKPRIEYYGAIYHVIARGNNNLTIFNNERHKMCLLALLNEAKEIYDFKIFAYAIMDNHSCLLMQTLNIPISTIMHSINTKYAKYYNKDARRTGPVFGNRYSAILVQDESYLLPLIKHVHNNPVKANICKAIVDYKWSSDIFYRMNMDNIVDINVLLNILSPKRNSAIRRYVELMDDQDEDYESLREQYEKGEIIGSEQFIKTIVTKQKNERKSLDEILKISCPTESEFNLIKQGSRKRYLTKYKNAYAQLSKKHGYRNEQIGCNIGVTGASVGKLLNK